MTLDTLAYLDWTRRLTAVSRDRELLRLSRATGVPVQAMRRVLYSVRDQCAGRPYNGPADFGKPY